MDDSFLLHNLLVEYSSLFSSDDCILLFYLLDFLQELVASFFEAFLFSSVGRVQLETVDQVAVCRVLLRELERALVVGVDLAVVELEVWSARRTFVVVFEVLEVHVEVAEAVELFVEVRPAVSGGLCVSSGYWAGLEAALGSSCR